MYKSKQEVNDNDSFKYKVSISDHRQLAMMPATPTKIEKFLFIILVIVIRYQFAKDYIFIFKINSIEFFKI